MRRRVALTLFGLVLASCQTAPAGPRLLEDEIFEDIPAPRNARIETDSAQSFAYSSESFRCAKYVYRFSGEIDEAIEFFSTTMTRPPYSWELSGNDDLPAGHARLSFAKGEEYCVVDMRTTTSRRSEPDLITITIRVNYE